MLAEGFTTPDNVQKKELFSKKLRGLNLQGLLF